MTNPDGAGQPTAGEVDAILADIPDRLGALDELPLSDQVAAYTELHGALTDVLGHTADPVEPGSVPEP